MAYTTKKAQAGSIALTAATVGQRLYTRLISGMRTQGLIFRLRGTVTLAGGPQTSLRNAGSLWSIVSQIGLEDNGDDVARISGRELLFLTQMISAQPRTFQRLSSYANGAYTLEESAYLPFSWPLAVSPTETCYVEPDPRNALQAFAVFDATAALLTTALGDAGTATLSNVSLDVIQVYDTEKIRPLFIPRYRTIQEVIAAANPSFPFYIKTDKLLRGIIIEQDTIPVGNVDDIITTLALRSDDREIIGPAQANFEDLARDQEGEFAGRTWGFGLDASAANTQPTTVNPFLGVNFQQSGRISNVLNPNLDRNLRAVMAVAPSVAAGVTSSLVKCTLLELARVPGITADSLPFEV